MMDSPLSGRITVGGSVWQYYDDRAKFGLGKVPSVFATVIYAAPPVVLLTDLRIGRVDAKVMEAATAFGANRRRR